MKEAAAQSNQGKQSVCLTGKLFKQHDTTVNSPVVSVLAALSAAVV